jgi:hypothetical protein
MCTFVALETSDLTQNLLFFTWGLESVFHTHPYKIEGVIMVVKSYILLLVLYSKLYTLHCGPGSSVGIATDYGLDGPRIESPVGVRFSALVQTSPGAHPASCTMGTGSLPGINSGRDVTLTPHPF